MHKDDKKLISNKDFKVVDNNNNKLNPNISKIKVNTPKQTNHVYCHIF